MQLSRGHNEVLEVTLLQSVNFQFSSLSKKKKRVQLIIVICSIFRHGIDLDNPGPNSSTSLLNSCSPSEAMPSAPLSDSGDSTGNRSADNATPPMHFLTPHVEISIPYNNEQPSLQRNQSPAPHNGDSPNSPQSADSNSNAPSSSHHQLPINSTPLHR